MERRVISGGNCDSGFNTLICQEDMTTEEHPYTNFNQDRQQVSTPSMTSWRPTRLAAVSLALLAAVLLIVDISLGVHYNNLKDTHLKLDDTERISNEMIKLQDNYKAAIKNMTGYKKQLDSEMSRQKPTNWELEHQTKRSQDYQVQIVKMTEDIASLRSHIPMINDGCRHCPPGWILMNSLCYYFSFSDYTGLKTWQKARDFCQMHGGDLAVIDTKDKENSTVNHLRHNEDPSKHMGFWIGLRDVHEEGTWRWLDGTRLVEGYWKDGEPNDVNSEDCATVYPKENFFKAWNDNSCEVKHKWICEKAPTSMS
ncbi:CD209 antigen-like protein E [Micropterus dolomieu]|uniref:CD209 antigen-like protein E n=1 Tax=Micropterus dolomieu TaxID=147949 RepID=UPI001E8D9E58|nr:CD209 antigen-like protein E [Micropterus dolomieu]XP_045919477.1 CD209 antigen-like protein E [Micropterus dolomieu]